nr:LysR family transcriptional regulator [Motilimonas sp. E26]
MTSSLNKQCGLLWKHCLLKRDNEVNQLGLFRTFIAVVELGSFTAAARHLGKTKSIVSKQVAQLEVLLNIRLFNRTTRAIHITEQGSHVYQHALVIIEQVDSLFQLNPTGNDSLTGRLRISAPHTFAETTLMATLPSFMKLHPKLKIELVLNDHYVDLIAAGFDLAFRIGRLDDSNLIARKIGLCQQMLVASPAFIDRHAPIEKLSQLADLPCVVDTNRREGSKWALLINGHTEQVRVNAQLEVNSAAAAAMAAASGIGIALLPDFAAAPFLESDTLTVVLPQYQSPLLGIYAIYPHRDYLTKKVTALLEHLA